MAQYNIVYACGHTGSINLIGKTAERERKLQWMASQKCPKCSGEVKWAKAQADTTPVTIEIHSTSGNVAFHDNPQIVLLAKGGTYQRREDLRALGFNFGESRLDTGVFDFLSLKKPEKIWHKIIDVAIEDFGNDEKLRAALGIVNDKIGEFLIKWEINPADIELLILGLSKAKEKKDKEAARKEEIGPSPLQKWIVENYGKDAYEAWNGKLYKNARIYIKNKEIHVSDGIATEQETWQKHRAEVNAKYATANN
jgi:hypothetical protein